MPKVRFNNNFFSHLINKKPFRLKKNGMPNNLFKKIDSNEHGGQININKNRINNNNLNRIKIDLRSNNEILEDDEQ